VIVPPSDATATRALRSSSATRPAPPSARRPVPRGAHRTARPAAVRRSTAP
jgi:hypothetical protein